MCSSHFSPWWRMTPYLCVVSDKMSLLLQHHLYSIRQAGRHPEDVWGVDPGSQSHAWQPLPVVHGWLAATLHLCGGQSQVCYNTQIYRSCCTQESVFNMLWRAFTSFFFCFCCCPGSEIWELRLIWLKIWWIPTFSMESWGWCSPPWRWDHSLWHKQAFTCCEMQFVCGYQSLLTWSSDKSFCYRLATSRSNMSQRHRRR